MVSVSRPALRYFGGKWRIAPWIIGHFPPHDCYVEPFAGGASVLMRKAPAPFEVYNDMDDEVVTFFRVLRERPDDLVRVIDATPWARAEYELAYQPCDVADELERARRLYVRSHQTRGAFRGTWRAGWKFQRSHVGGRSTVASWQTADYLRAIATRLKMVQIECDDAVKVIARFDTPRSLFYVDPPYVQATRGERWRGTSYRHEMDDADQEVLAAALHAVKGMVILSGYPSPLYQALYPDWLRIERPTRNTLAQSVTEVLWLSPRAAAAAVQRRLFEEPETPHEP